MSTKLDPTALSRRLEQVAQALRQPTAPSYLDLARDLDELRHDLDHLVRHVIHLARSEQGTTWQQIAERFDLAHRQAAQRRWR